MPAMTLYGEIIDSRDLVKRLEELRDQDELDEEERAELEELESVEREGISDWQYGETFIRDDYFITYAQELAEDIGAISSDYSWPQSHIDWQAAADALAQDYTEVELNGSTYLVRA